MRLDFLAREPHFLDHLAPVWMAVGRERRGTFHVAPSLAERAAKLGIGVQTKPPERSLNPVLVASLGDLRAASKVGRTVYLTEHGAGQSYSTGHASYAGGVSPERQKVPLFLVPNEWAAERNRKSNPKARVEVVGCPKLDSLPDMKREGNTRPVVAVSFHWHCQVCPETRWAFPHFSTAIRSLKDSFTVLGHAHPRAWAQLKPFYLRTGIEPVEDFREVVSRADVYVCDNSSTIFEFAAADKPVVLLNAPWYRRHVKHGLRFWDCADVGIQTGRPAGLVGAVAEALESDGTKRRLIVERVYPFRGESAERAARVLEETLR